MKAPRILQARSPGHADEAASPCRPGTHADAEAAPAALRLAHAVSVGLAAVLAAGVLMLASLRAVEADPVIVGAPASEPAGPADTTLIARSLLPASPTGDSLSRCFYDALTSQGGTVDGPGHQRTDPACQRR